MLGKWVLKKILKCNRDEAVGRWGKLYNERLYYFCPAFINVMESAQLIRYSDGLRTGFNSWQSQGIFIYSTASALTQSPPASYPVGTADSIPGVKQPVHEADHSHPSSTEVKNGGAIPRLPHSC
jgi:hypothetical protein